MSNKNTVTSRKGGKRKSCEARCAVSYPDSHAELLLLFGEKVRADP